MIGMKTSLLVLLAIFSLSSVEGAWVIQNGQLKNAEKIATMSLPEHYAIACRAYELHDWNAAASHFCIVCTNFPKSSVAAESAFFQGICLYELGELEFSNEAFNNYLANSQPKYFQETMDYKFAIANEFCSGARRRFFGSKQMPKWLSARNLCVQIYDEIIQSMPCHEYAAQSLWAKGLLLWEDCAYQDTVDTYQTLIRRFPKHELTPQAYVAINQVYLAESEWEFQNPDLLPLAEINLKKFKQEFPRDERVAAAEVDLLSLKESYACGLWKTGKFYEGQGKCGAAIIYYMNAVKQFPSTKIAEKCQQRLQSLQNANL